jgi:hypothetical protein
LAIGCADLSRHISRFIRGRSVDKSHRRPVRMPPRKRPLPKGTSP